MQAELEKKYSATVELIGGGGGIYEVTVDGKLIFDKFSSGRFPNDNEVVELIEKLK
ncbi:MAG: Rdx family protein [Deltaproteobacteria bacterium]|nr:Rdx family protein [Deltaproteobacteria bacterium]